MKLADSLKVLLANTFAFRIKAQNYHWNVTGQDFVQYHNFLGDLYTSADSNIDTIAEHIRGLDAYAPGSFSRFLELSTIKDETSIPPALEMINRLSSDCIELHKSMTTARDIAEAEKQRGVVNFLEGLIDDNEKTQWMLKSIIKK